MHARENIQNGFWFSFGFGVAILLLVTGCFYLTEAGLSLLNPKPKQEKGETQVDKENVRIGHEEDNAQQSLLYDVVDLPVVEPNNFKAECFYLRGRLLTLEEYTIKLMEHSVFEEGQNVYDANDPNTLGAAKYVRDHSEMKANIMLTYRHLEDARMRLGKAIQAFDGVDLLQEVIHVKE